MEYEDLLVLNKYPQISIRHIPEKGIGVLLHFEQMGFYVVFSFYFLPSGIYVSSLPGKYLSAMDHLSEMIITFLAATWNNQ